MELLANKFSWEILKKIILKALGESSNSAIEEGVAGGDADDVQEEVQQQCDNEMHCKSSIICRQDWEEEANFSAGERSERHVEEGAAVGDADVVPGEDQQEGGDDAKSNSSSSICHDFEGHANSSSSGRIVKPVEEVAGVVRGEDQQRGGDQMPHNSEDVAVQPLVPGEMSEYEKIRAANVKQKEVFLRQLKRDWQGFKKSEKFATGASRKGVKKLKFVEKEISHSRTKYCQPSKSMTQDRGTSGTGLDNG